MEEVRILIGKRCLNKRLLLSLESVSEVTKLRVCLATRIEESIY